jgi:glutamine amidotransferase
MGWNEVHQSNAHPLWKDIPQDSRFYFVHSYYAQPSSKDVIAATTNYGVEFASAASQKNVFAVQFHPEKSQNVGLKLLENFMQWDGLS